MQRFELRAQIAKNIVPLMFLASYFLTVVLGNLLYSTSYGAELLAAAGLSVDALNFKTTFSAGYWTLILMPFVVVPIAVPLLRTAMQRFIVGPIVRVMPDFRRIDYLIMLAGVMAFVGYSFWRVDAFALLGNATNAQEAIEARFTLQARMSFPEKVAMHSLMPFLGFYALAAAIKTDERFWQGVSVMVSAATIAGLVVINMKWPVLVFYIGLIMGIFTFTRRWAFSKTILGGIGLVAIYLLISTYVFRWVPHDLSAPPATEIEAAEPPPQTNLDYSGLAKSSYRAAPLLFAHAINRMAVPYPYYYRIFTEEGPVCGTLFETYLPGKKPCAPTFLVYSRIFPGDGYTGRGSSPAAAHITAYAQGSWTGAILAIAIVAVVLAGFSAIPLSAGPMAAAFTIVGVTVGYHYSQLPVEGPLTYDHGVIWPLLMVAIYTAVRHAVHFFRQV
jgi:hypothetical protein